MSQTRTIYRDQAVSPDTSEYLTAVVTSKPSAPGEVAPDLDMVVRFTFDRATYYDATWLGDQTTSGNDKKRTAALLLTEANVPARGNRVLYIRITDNPEAPIVKAGNLNIQ